MEGEMITLQKLFEFKIDRFDADRHGDRPAAVRPVCGPTFLAKFERHGIALPAELFGDTENAIFGVNGAEPASWVKAGDDR